MHKKMTALALAGVLSLGLLAGCTKGGETPTPTPTVTPSATTAPIPTPTPAPTDTPAPMPTDTPAPSATPAPVPSAVPAPTKTPAPKPTATPAPTAPVAPTPTPEVDVVASVWGEIEQGELPALMDVDAAVLQDLYGLSDSDLVSYVCKIPMMSANITEYFIAQVAEGRMDAVKAACLKRQENLAGGFLYPSQTELVTNYKLVTKGNYILFCITDAPDAAVNAFDTYAKG